ncbi:cupin domain-containing protein [Mesorhizobium sp. LMG 17147]|uniref:cupin domain-containing protein n=1 Tax=Mesorhizobium sp. LMG 17147 TaxID=2963091 RepID=UPI0034A4B351
MHVSACNGATQLCIFEQWVEPAVGAPTHWHPVEEVLTVIAGRAEMWIDDEHRTVACCCRAQATWLPKRRLRTASYPCRARVTSF